ncbi:hypothetical protein [Staphylococcus chromogenes]|uniref:hypothetical protein n=1 Tax=Staphylococcus chromogenes TaxID=46126 RepID=UPI00188FD24B|nr:hypothetical protein [Staphylococcus chromogenes]
MKKAYFGNLSKELDQLVDRNIQAIANESKNYGEVINKLIEDKTIQNSSKKFEYIKNRILKHALNQKIER